MGTSLGYLAIEQDGFTVKGAVFAHKGETPGLGAEISTPMFQDRFAGKRIFDKTGKFTSVEVIKGGYDPTSPKASYQVDGITGGTITCNGVDDMLYQSILPYTELLNPLLNQN